MDLDGPLCVEAVLQFLPLLGRLVHVFGDDELEGLLGGAALGELIEFKTNSFIVKLNQGSVLYNRLTT